MSAAAPLPLSRRLLRELAYVVVLGTPVLLFFLVAAPRSNAVRFLKQLNRIQVNQTHFQQVEQLAGQFGSYAACMGDNCLFQFQNQWLHLLHLAPSTQFSVMMQRGGSPSDPGGGTVGTLDMAMLVSRDDAGGGAIASALVFERAHGDPRDPYQASITFGSDGRPGRTVVTLAPGSSPRQRSRARAFNLQCLTRLGGCKNSRDLLPSVWQGARRIESVGLYAPAPSPGAAARRLTAWSTFGAVN
ncbi:MAG TPA: hypothetical protein VN515_09115 [Terriglobales bacterium]|nr:hypothetical protein [Terriglobales bacterium]